MNRIFTAFFVLFLSACGPQKLPIEIFIEDSWGQVEEFALASAMREWNKAGTRLQSPDSVFVLAGRVYDTLDRDDYHDGRSVIYRVTDTAWMTEKEVGWEGKAHGWQNGDDVAINVAKISPLASMSDDALAIFKARPELWNALMENHARGVRNVAIHELGHLLGLEHNDKNPYSVMYPEVRQVAELQEDDIREFCKLYACGK